MGDEEYQGDCLDFRFWILDLGDWCLVLVSGIVNIGV